MAVAVSISPVTLAALASTPPVAIQLLTTAAASSTASVVASRSSLVELSNNGQLLAALSTFSNDLAALQTNVANNTPLAVASTTQDLLDSFNQQLPGNPLATQFSRALSELVTTSIAIDPANPAGSPALPVDATQSLIDLTSEFAAQVVSAALPPANPSQPAATITPEIDLASVLGLPAASLQDAGLVSEPLPDLDAATVLEAIQLASEDLAAAELEAASLLTEDGVIAGTPAATLLTPNNPPAIARNQAPTEAATDAPNQLASPAPTLETPVTTAQALPPPASTPLSTNQESAALADRQASEATLALQNLLAAPSLRAFNNHFDPAYSALIAASHLGDFVSPNPGLNPKALLADTVAPVVPIAVARAIGYYNEAADEHWQQFARRGAAPQWYA